MAKVELKVIETVQRRFILNSRREFCGLCLASLAFGCWQSPKPKAESIAKVISLKRLDTNESQEDTFTITSKDAFLLQFDVEPLPNRPADCSHPLSWHCYVVFLRKYASKVEESFSNCTSRNPVKDLQYTTVPFQGTARHWAKKPSDLQFPQDEVVNEKVISFMTFVASPFQTPGDFDYEVRLYPRFKWVNSTQFKPGDPIVIKKGVVKVTN